MNLKFRFLIILVSLGCDLYGQDPGAIVSMMALSDFPVLTRDGMASNRKPYGPYHAEKDLNALAGDDLNYTFQMASAEGVFPGKAGNYTVCLNTLTERDGECVYNIYVNDEKIGLFQQNPPTNEFTAPANLVWKNVMIPANARIRVESNNWSNLQRHEDNFYEYARGRWTGIDFIPEPGFTPSGQKNNIGIFYPPVEGEPARSIPGMIFNSTENSYYFSIPAVRGAGEREGTGFAGRQAAGDFELEALVTLIGDAAGQTVQGGLMIRVSSGRDSPFIACLMTGKDQGIIQIREIPSGPVREIQFSCHESEMIEVTRDKGHIGISTARLGDEYTRNIVQLTGFDGKLTAGLLAGPGRASSEGVVRFSKVRFFQDLYRDQ